MAINFAKGIEKVRAGKNVWVRWGGYEGTTVMEVIHSDERPEGEFAPFYPASRVRGDTYEYYDGRSEWEIAANAAMASEANSNFRRGQSY
jgi:hypothetical protein